MHDWLEEHPTPEQVKETASQKTSIFGVWVRKTFGSKAFLCATFQCGLTLMPSGAPEHACHFTSHESRAIQCMQEVMNWLAAFADALIAHRASAAYKKAQQRSGTKRGESGLTGEQRDVRQRRDQARRRLQRANNLQAEVDAYWKCDYRRFRYPRSWKWLQSWEQRELKLLQDGVLQREYEGARAAHGGAVAAEPFRMQHQS